MPKETEPARIELMLRLLRAADPNAVVFTATSMSLGHRKDQGLIRLLPATIPAEAKPDLLKEAMIAFLEAGQFPHRKDEAADADMGFEAATFYNFRLRVEDVALFVKTVLEEEEGQPILKIISVKPDDLAWK